jgi:magnesium-transporting ATPase (P-type)
MAEWHAVTPAEAVSQLEVDPATGLATDEVTLRRARHGDNALVEPRRRSTASVVLSQFRNPLIYLLFAAAALALMLGERSDAIVIFVVVVLNAVIGAIQEGRAEHALAALRQLARQKARVRRDGEEHVIDARQLVPGDILLLGAGDAITADVRLLEAASLQVAEAALTGESVPVRKDTAPVTVDTELGDRASMAYAGTLVTAGRGTAVVVATGARTEIGHIAALAESTGSMKTPLERRIDQFGRYVMIGAGVLLVLFFTIGMLRGISLPEIAMLAISQVVGLIPEGLPVAMTIALAVGVQRMARRGAIVRRLGAVETLGSTTVICSDKTGTLTRNEMTVTAIWLAGGRELAITGSGYAPHGTFHDAGRELDPATDRELGRFCEAIVLCNDARVSESEERWRIVGDPTEAALVTAAMKAGIDVDELRRRMPRRAELPFDPAVKMMATQHDTPDGPRIIIKGATESILELCGDGAEHELVKITADRLASRALRVLAIAEVAGTLDPRVGYQPLHGRATLLGLVGEIDPPRDEAMVAVANCRTAGIRPVMVTGDQAATGIAIARALGIARDGDLAITGSELETLSDGELDDRIDRVAVFARVQPAQKLRIVSAYQKRGEVVAMTGDGVNDAPALARADVGVAMGITGTDAAKQAAKIVVTDDNFGTIVAAVEQGRVVYHNIKKAALFLFATSLAEVLVLLLAVALGYPAPFVAVQILWNNLITEGVITVNLVMDPPEGDEMQRPPTKTDEPLITRAMLWRLAVMTPAIVTATLGWFIYRISTGVPSAVAGAETFTLLAVCEWFNVLNCLSDHRSAFSLRLFRNPWLLGGLVVGNLLQIMVIFVPAFNDIFHTVPFGIEQVLAIGLVGSLVLWAEELRKLVVRMQSPRRGTAAACA